MNAALAMLACVFAALASGVLADPLPPALAQAEAGVERIWAQTPLALRTLTFVDAESQGFGLYDPRRDAVFRPGEKLLTYCEPVGFGWKDIGDGRFEIGFVVDFRVLDEKGKALGSQESFAAIRKETRAHNREFSVDLTMSVTDFPPGRYVLEYTLHDIASAKKLTFQQNFEIAHGA